MMLLQANLNLVATTLTNLQLNRVVTDVRKRFLRPGWEDSYHVNKQMFPLFNLKFSLF